MKKLTLVSAILLTATVAMAQTRPVNPPQRSLDRGMNQLQGNIQRVPGAGLTQLKEYLGLTDDQITDIRTLQKTQREQLRPLAQQMAQTSRQLREELQKEPVDSAVVSNLRAQIKALTAELQAKQKEYTQQLRATLNADQQAKLAELEEAMKQRDADLRAIARQAAMLGLIDAPRNSGGLRGNFRRGFMNRPVPPNAPSAQPLGPRNGFAPARKL